MRIGGLASGMDIDTMVKDLMKAERIPLDKYKQQKQKLEWQRDDYRAINTLLLDFRSDLTQMKLTTKYRVRNVSTTNDERVTATASSAASLSSYSIGKVTQLASAATRINEGRISTDSKNKIDPSKGLYSQESKFAQDSAFTWSTGVVESKTIKVGEDNKVNYSLDLAQGALKQDEIANMSVKVNGISYKIVTDRAIAADNEVSLDADGNLNFYKAPKKDSVIKVDYVLNNKTVSKKVETPIKEWQLADGALVNDSSFSLSVGGVDYTISSSAAIDGDGFVSMSTTATSPEYSVKINLETGKIKFFDTSGKEAELKKDTQLNVTYKQHYTNFNITSYTSKGPITENFLVEGSESLNQVVSRVNGSNAGVSMFYDSNSDRISLTRTETGNFRGIDSSPSSSQTYLVDRDGEIQTGGDFFNKLLKFENATETGGENAIFVINGLVTERNSNTFDINGVTFTLKQTFTDVPVNLSISNDSSKVVDNIKEFVTKYNELIDKIQKKVNEEVYRSYQPLTDDQRESLSDKQQEQWEEKAKSGLLRRDPILSSVLTKMRLNFSNPVQNDDVNPIYSQLASIGIKTTANYLEGGKLEINEAELKAAIEADPSSVEKLFNGSGETDSQKGIVQRLYDTVSASFDQLKEKAGNSNTTNANFDIGKLLNNVNKQIDRFEDKMIKVEDRYWRQFTAMEKAIQRSNEQMGFLMNQFGGGM